MSRRPIFKRKPKTKKVIPARSGAPRSGVKFKTLERALGELAEKPEENRDKVLQLLKQTRQTAMDDAVIMFKQGRHGGIETARHIAVIHDRIIQALYNFTTNHVIEKPAGKLPIMAVCAIGGYGRGEMAPCSDLDLLFLVPDKKGQEYAEKITEYMLYMLWDLGLKVGQSIRTIDQNIQLAKTDQTILTALLDLRFICGDQKIAEKLFTKFKKTITKGKGRNYIAAKLEERDIRHDRAGNSRYVIDRKSVV